MEGEKLTPAQAFWFERLNAARDGRIRFGAPGGMPEGTARGLIRRGLAEVVTLAVYPGSETLGHIKGLFVVLLKPKPAAEVVAREPDPPASANAENPAAAESDECPF